MSNIKVTVQNENNVLLEVTPVPIQTIAISRGVAGRGVADVTAVEISGALYLEFTFTDGTTELVGPVGTIQYIGQSPIVVSGSTISLTTVPVTLGGTGQITANAGFNALAPTQTGNAGKYLTTDGSNTSWASNPLGTVTSVDMSVPTGLTVSGNPITTSGTLAVALQSGYSIPTTASQTNWDTAYSERQQWDGGATNLVASTGRTSLGLGTIATQDASAVSITGGTITGITDLAVADGGTGASTAAGAMVNLLPSYTGNASKRLSLNSGATGLEWVTDGGGTVTSIDVSGGTTGLTFTGGPVTTSGTITLGGTLDVDNGGTGATTAAGARTNLNAVDQALTLTAGTGLSGGGDLTANRSFSIANTGVTAASYGAASKTLTATVNAQGQLTALADTDIAISNTQISGLGTMSTQNANAVAITGGSITGITDLAVADGGTGASDASGARTNLGAAASATTISAGTGLSGGGDLSANRTLSIANTAVTAASYGSASDTLTATVNAQGQLTAMAATPIAISNTQVSGLGTMSTQNSNAVTITGGSITGITDLAIADGGTGASNAADARSNLGLGTAAVLNAGVALGVATLDAGGTVPLSQIPASIQGGVSYQGSWNAATNMPTLTSSVGTKGYYYVVSVAGSTNLNGITDWLPGDWAIFNGTAWEQIDNTDAVASVNGYTGVVVLTNTDVGAPSTSLTISAGTGLSGGGDLSTNRTISIANTAVTAASYGTASAVPTFTVNGQGQLTAAADVNIAIANTQVSGLGTMSTQNANSVAITGGSITGITDLAIADGGTGASNAADARTNLGVTATGSDTTYLYRANNLSDLASASTARTNLGLGTAATQDSTAFATAAQGALADTAIQTLTSTDGSVTITPTGTSRDLSVAVAASTNNVLCQVRNTTGATLIKGTVVYISGATGQLPTVSKAIATGDATSAQTLGMITADLANNSNGNVTIIGLIQDIDTSSYTDGAQLYLSGTTAGAVTATKPSAPTHLVYVAVVEYAHPTQGKLFVKVQNGYELDEIHDVQIVSPTTGQTLVYNSSTSLWNNSNAPVISGTTINNTTIGATTASTGAFTSLTATSGVISANTSSDALRITQTGAGNALVVEDAANPDSTPFVIDANGQVIVGNDSALTYASGVVPQLQVNKTGAEQIGISRFSADTGSNAFVFLKSRGATINSFDVVASGDGLGSINWYGADGTAGIQAATITAAVDGTPSTNDMPGRLVFSTTADGASSPTERMRITSTGAIGIGGTPAAGRNFVVSSQITGSATSRAYTAIGTVQSDVTSTASYFATSVSIQDAAFTLTNLAHFQALQGTISGGSRLGVTNQFGYFADSSITGATNNYGFYGNIASGTGRWNLYMVGTADNYLGGALGIGNTTLTARTLGVSKAITGAVTAYGIVNNGAIQSDVTTNAFYNWVTINTAAGAYTTTNAVAYYANQGTIGASSAITNQFGFLVASTLTGATNNYGFCGDIASGSGRYNLYMSGTAVNYLAGSLGIGTNAPGSALDVKGTLRLSGSSSGYVGFAPAAAAGSTTYTLPSADGTSGQFLSTNGSGTLSWATGGSGSSQWTTSGSNIYYTTGNVGIGTATPTFATGGGLQVKDSSFASVRVTGGSNTGLDISQTSTGSAYVYLRDNFPLVFGTNDTERMRVNAGAPILCLSGGNTSATGTGIAFPATQSASSDANTLDDYEEGSWTPTVGGTATYNAQNGRYRKVGALCTISCEMHINTIGTGSTSVIYGAPFTPASGSGTSSGPIGYASGLANSVITLNFRLDSNDSAINNIALTSAATTTPSGVAIFANNTRVLFSITYPTA